MTGKGGKTPFFTYEAMIDLYSGDLLMSWLKDLHNNTVFHYSNPSGEIVSGLKEDLDSYFGRPISCTPGDTVELEGITYSYSGFEPQKLGITTKTVFEKNGRKAILIKDGKGKNIVRSLSKENHLNGKGTNSVLTKGCIEKSNKVKEQILHSRWKSWTAEGRKQ